MSPDTVTYTPLRLTMKTIRVNAMRRTGGVSLLIKYRQIDFLVIGKSDNIKPSSHGHHHLVSSQKHLIIFFFK